MRIGEFYKEKLIEKDESFCFTTVPINKVIILSIATWGIYDIFMMYGWWKSLRNHFDLKISPFWRAFFGYFTNFKLFPLFEAYFKRFNIAFAGLLFAILVLVINQISSKLNFYTLKYEKTVWGLEIISYILLFITTGITVYIQNNINKINKEHYPNAPKNKWKISNILWSIILILLTLLAYISDFIPEIPD